MHNILTCLLCLRDAPGEGPAITPLELRRERARHLSFFVFLRHHMTIV